MSLEIHLSLQRPQGLVPPSLAVQTLRSLKKLAQDLLVPGRDAPDLSKYQGRLAHVITRQPNLIRYGPSTYASIVELNDGSPLWTLDLGDEYLFVPRETMQTPRRLLVEGSALPYDPRTNTTSKDPIKVHVTLAQKPGENVPLFELMAQYTHSLPRA